MKNIIPYSAKKIANLPKYKKRYLYYDLEKSKEQIKGIIGIRGVGKTTILLQLAQKHNKSIYISVDSLFLKGKNLFDLIKDLYENFGFRNFFIDEIHKYKNWQQVLKTLYDFFDDIAITFSGSSSMDLVHGTYDLSRRTVLYPLYKLSFREYLNLKYNKNLKTISSTDVFDNPVKLSFKIYEEIPDILIKFKEYLKVGELSFSIKSSENYEFKLENIIKKMVYEDIAVFYKLKTENIGYFFEILKFLSQSSPSVINYQNIAKSLHTTADTVKSYINILKEIGLVNVIGKEGYVSINLRKSKKILLELINVFSLFYDDMHEKSIKGMIRESFVLSSFKKEGSVFYPDKGDFLWIKNNKKYLLEVGGKNKTFKQLKNKPNGYLIKDDILFAETKNQIPIWLLGFFY